MGKCYIIAFFMLGFGFSVSITLCAHFKFEDRHLPTLAIFHTKGGVGKTATAVNLAYLAAQSGAPTLICDLDAQGSATFYFRVRPQVQAGARVITKGGKHLAQSIKET